MTLSRKSGLAVGVHEAVAPEIYHADPCAEPSLSASIIQVLLTRSPLHAWHAHPKLNPAHTPTVSSTFDLGTVVHDLFLRGIDDTAVIIDAPDWRSKAAQEARDAARAVGLTPLLTKDAERAQRMVAAIGAQLAARDDDPPLFSAGKPEQTIVWRERGVTCRARLDLLHDDLAAIDDLKTAGASANPHDWGRTTFWGIGADIQARFYQRGIKALTGTEPAFRFAVVEAREPFCMSVLDLAPSAVELADAKIDKALEIWRRCLDSGVWPGYPAGVASVESTWQEADFVQRFWEPEEARS